MQGIASTNETALVLGKYPCTDRCLGGTCKSGSRDRYIVDTCTFLLKQHITQKERALQSQADPYFRLFSLFLSFMSL